MRWDRQGPGLLKDTWRARLGRGTRLPRSVSTDVLAGQPFGTVRAARGSEQFGAHCGALNVLETGVSPDPVELSQFSR